LPELSDVDDYEFIKTTFEGDFFPPCVINDESEIIYEGKIIDNVDGCGSKYLG
jgi:hypothetical protein